MTIVRARPRRLRLLCWAAAAAVLAGFVVLAVALPGRTGGGGAFRAGDRAALVGVGVVFAGAILTLTRPRVEADDRGIRIRNLVGSYDLSWDLVRAVRFERRSPWASLELTDDERIGLMAVQALDREDALEAVTGLRALLAEARRS